VTTLFPHLTTLIAITRLAVFIALSGSLWAMLRGKSCQTCHKATSLTGGLPLGRIGTAFYGMVLLATFLPGSLPAAWALAAAVGAHVVLVILLFSQRLFCRNCLLIAAAAVLAATTTILIDPSHNAWSLLAAPVGALATLVGIGISAAALARRSMKRAEILLAEAAKESGPIAAGTVRMIILSKPGCYACVLMQDQILPELQKEFDGIMEVEHRIAPEGTPAPTLLILGKNAVPFIGAAPAEAISPSIRMALGHNPAQLTPLAA
jgi:hypothetical protein